MGLLLSCCAGWCEPALLFLPLLSPSFPRPKNPSPLSYGNSFNVGVAPPSALVLLLAAPTRAHMRAPATAVAWVFSYTAALDMTLPCPPWQRRNHATNFTDKMPKGSQSTAGSFYRVPRPANRARSHGVGTPHHYAVGAIGLGEERPSGSRCFCVVHVCRRSTRQYVWLFSGAERWLGSQIVIVQTRVGWTGLQNLNFLSVSPNVTIVGSSLRGSVLSLLFFSKDGKEVLEEGLT